MRDLAAEMGVLAAVLIDNRALVTVRGVLGAEDFSAPRHAVIFETFVALAEKGEPLDVLTVVAELRDAERLNSVGGAQYIGELTDYIPTIAHCEAHARIVADLAQRRRTVDAAARIAAYAREHGGDDLAGYAMKLLREAAPRISQQVKTAEQVAEALSARLEHVIAQGPESTDTVGLRTGMPTLDETLSLGDGRLYVVAARPAMGKSALAGQIAHHVAAGDRGRVLFFAEEMPAVEVAHRDVAGRAGVDDDIEPVAKREERVARAGGPDRGVRTEHRVRLAGWVQPLGLPPKRLSLHVIEARDPAEALLDFVDQVLEVGVGGRFDGRRLDGSCGRWGRGFGRRGRRCGRGRNRTASVRPVVVDPVDGAVLTITGKIGEIDAENNIVRVDISTVFNETAVLGKAQARVRI